MAEMASESEMDSLQQKVLRRAKELSRIQAGKASETISSVNCENKDTDSLDARNSPSIDALFLAEGVSDTSSNQRGNRDHVVSEPERGASAVGGNGSEKLWEKIKNIEATMLQKDNQQADLLSNIVLSVAKLHKKLDTSVSHDSIPVRNENETQPPASGFDDLDLMMESKQNESKTFLSDLEESYKEDVKFGPAVDEKLSQVVNQAIEKPLNEDAMKNLEEKYLTPENCQKLCAPKVNKELWQAFKPTRPADLAMQASHKFMGMAMVPVIQTLELLMKDGDREKVKELTKDTFRILAQGMNANTRKRRELIRPVVPLKYRKVCSNDHPVSENLFGENLDQRVDDIEKEERRSQKLSGQTRPTYGRAFLGTRFPQGNRPLDPKLSTRMQGKNQHRNVPPKYSGKPQPKWLPRRK